MTLQTQLLLTAGTFVAAVVVMLAGLELWMRRKHRRRDKRRAEAKAALFGHLDPEPRTGRLIYLPDRKEGEDDKSALP